MTRTHTCAFVVVTLLGCGTGFAQPPVPAPVPAPRPVAPVSPIPPRALGTVRGARQIQIPDLHVQVPELNIHVPEIALPDFDLQIPEFNFDFPEFNVDVPEFNFDFDHNFDFDFDFDYARDFDVDVDWQFDFARNFANGIAVQGPRPPQPPQPSQAPQAPQAPRPIFGDSRSPEGLYDQARGYIDRDQYDRALQSLDRLIAQKGARADAAMYWRAYSLSKLARSAEALTTLAELRKQYSNSSWIRDAGFLELEIKQSSGQAVNAEAQVSEDMKLLALQGIMRSDPATAIPVVEKTLAGNSSIRVKERALFVLSQSRETRAREVITNVARGSGNPDLKISAIRYLGRTSGPEVVQSLEEIYRNSSDVDVKRAVLQALSSARATERLGAIARNEKDAALRQSAVRYLGSSNTPEAAEALRALYAGDSSQESRRAVVDSLSNNRNGAAALVALARAEKDGEMKTYIVRRLTNMRDPAAQQYLMELLSK